MTTWGKWINSWKNTCMLSRLNQEELENINKTITSSEIENVIKNIPTKKSRGPYSFTDNLSKRLEKR